MKVEEGRWCSGCERPVRRWEQLGGKVGLAVEVLEDGTCRDIHTLELVEARAHAYACERCGTEVRAADWFLSP